jgi:predicted RNase H-like HicB family nuclease
VFPDFVVLTAQPQVERYQARFELDRKAGGYVVAFPDFGYGVTQGETEEEAMDIARDLLVLTIGDYIREGKSLPAPLRRRGAKFRAVVFPALQSAKVDLPNWNSQDAR